ncbi:MAG: serine hydrolase [Hydrogenophilaceae bacterium]|jgi:CubicO group peptidase (beta-lactamase class C family)|nr:serine hydrolase [Hydrogenophilaceae bacterium]
MGIDRRALLLSAGAVAVAGHAAAETRASVRPTPPLSSPSLFDTTPENQAVTYMRADRNGPARIILRGRRSAALAAHARPLDGLDYAFGGGRRSVDDYMRENRVSGLIILKRGEVALERYAMGLTPSGRWTGFSVAKPMTTTLAGAALAEGAIESLDDPAVRYVPALAGSAYAQVTIRNLMRLMSGVDWEEDVETSAGAGLAAVDAAARSGDRNALFRVMTERPRAAEQGAVFNYNTGEAYVLGEVIACATGKTLAGYMSEKIWAPMGAEADATWLTCASGGPELCGYGINATLRDYARFALFIAHDGVVGPRRILPQGWRDLAGQPDNPVTRNGFLEEGYPLGHGYMWWTMPTGADALPNHDAAFTAQGIHGQIMYINARESVVAMVTSAWREAWETPREMETYALLGEAVARLR